MYAWWCDGVVVIVCHGDRDVSISMHVLACWSVTIQGVSIRLRVYGYARVCVCDGDGEQVDR